MTDTQTDRLLRPRPYQWECIESVHVATSGFDVDDRDMPLRRSVVVLPTGAGKTVIFSWIAAEWTDYVKRGQHTGRVLILVHRDELVNQTLDKLSQVAPNLRVGAIRGKENDHDERDVIVASVQTLRRSARMVELEQTGSIGLVIVDECHHATAGSYRRIMEHFGCFTEYGAYAVGFTATLTRADSARLADVWQKVIYRRDILDMINGYVAPNGYDWMPGGYLTDVVGKMVTVDGFSLAEVTMNGGDYQVGSLSEALLSADAPDFVAKAYAEHAAERPGVVFTPTVETAHAFADALKERGISAEPVWGAMPLESRREVIAAFRAGGVQVLVNCMVLTEGFDAPRAEVAVIARPTTSSGLYVQMVGRVLRPYPGKKSALVLDIVGASKEHRLASLADLTTERVKEVREGESLMEAVYREKAERNPNLRGYVVTYEDVDLFQQSRAHFLQTYEGIWFVASRDNVWFVWPGKKPDTYNVGTRPLRGRGGGWLHEGLPLESAMAWCETEALRGDESYGFGTYTSRNASWRKRREPASEGQLRLAAQMRLKVPAGTSKRELADMMTVEQVSRILDRPLKRRK